MYYKFVEVLKEFEDDDVIKALIRKFEDDDSKINKKIIELLVIGHSDKYIEKYIFAYIIGFIKGYTISSCHYKIIGLLIEKKASMDLILSVKELMKE